MQVNGTWFCADARSAIFSADEQNRWVGTLYRLQLCCAVLCCNNSNEHKNVFSKCLQQNLRQINVSIAECFIFHVFILYLSLFCFCVIEWYRYRDLSFFHFPLQCSYSYDTNVSTDVSFNLFSGCLFVCLWIIQHTIVITRNFGGLFNVLRAHPQLYCYQWTFKRLN